MILTVAFILAAAPKLETLFFVTSDCPISKRFTPEIKRIMKDFQGTSTFKYIYEDTGTTYDKMKAHHNEYTIKCPLSLDPKQALAKKYGVKGVPTVVVQSAKGEVFYQGRVDDSYGSDFKWHAAKQKDLRNALTALKNGEHVKVRQTKVIGCALNQ